MAKHNKQLNLKTHLCCTALLPPLKQILLNKLHRRQLQRTGYVIKAKADSGASKHFWRDCDKAILQNIRTIMGPKVA
jgi:hypothetical protein